MSKDVDNDEHAHDETPMTPDEMGGESSCFVQYFCADCGVQLDGTAHRPECTAHVEPSVAS
jgi:hypothetical protein